MLKVTNTSAVFVDKRNENDNKSLLKESSTFQNGTTSFCIACFYFSLFSNFIFAIRHR